MEKDEIENVNKDISTKTTNLFDEMNEMLLNFYSKSCVLPGWRFKEALLAVSRLDSTCAKCANLEFLSKNAAKSKFNLDKVFTVYTRLLGFRVQR